MQSRVVSQNTLVVPANAGTHTLELSFRQGGGRVLRAFSSEVDTGSREENASKQKSRARFRFNQNRIGSRPPVSRLRLGSATSKMAWRRRIANRLFAPAHAISG